MLQRKKFINLAVLCQIFISGGLFRKISPPASYTNVLGWFASWICSQEPETSITSFPFTDMIALTGFANWERATKFAKEHDEYLQKATRSFLKAMEKLETFGLEKPSNQSASIYAGNIKHFLEILKIDEYDNYQKAYDFLDTKEFFSVLRGVMKEDKVRMPSKQFIADLRKFHIQNMYLFVAQIMNEQAMDKLRSLVEADLEFCRLIAQIIMQEAANRPYEGVDEARVKNVRTLLDLAKVEYTDKMAEAISCMHIEDVVKILSKSKIEDLPSELKQKLSAIKINNLARFSRSTPKEEADL